MTVTLATLEQSTAQEVFDHVAKHLLTQKTKCVSDESKDDFGIMSRCAYKNKHSMSCAAGCIIADNEYKIDMEGKTWIDLIRYKMVPEAHYELIDNLQAAHDLKKPQEWPTAIQAVAKYHNLAIGEEIRELIANF